MSANFAGSAAATAEQAASSSGTADESAAAALPKRPAGATRSVAVVRVGAPGAPCAARALGARLTAFASGESIGIAAELRVARRTIAAVRSRSAAGTP
jgi:hypothetical protein